MVCGTPWRAELEGGERGALIARARFVDPDMQRNACVMRHVDRRERGAPIDAGEPAGIAMGEDVERCRLLFRGRFAEDFEAVLADACGRSRHLRRRWRRLRARRAARAFVARLIAHRIAHALQRPAQIDRRGARLEQHVVGAVERFVGWHPRAWRAPCHKPRSRRSAARRARSSRWIAWAASSALASVSVTNSMRQLRLVDDLDGIVADRPDGAVRFAVDFHGGVQRAVCGARWPHGGILREFLEPARKLADSVARQPDLRAAEIEIAERAADRDLADGRRSANFAAARSSTSRPARWPRSGARSLSAIAAALPAACVSA